MPDPASTKQTTADLVAKLLALAVPYSNPRVVKVFQDAADALEALATDNARLRGFARDVLDQWWEKCLDGADLQDFGAKHGLIEEYAAPADNDCACDEPEAHKCNRFTRILHGDANAGGGE